MLYISFSFNVFAVNQIDGEEVFTPVKLKAIQINTNSIVELSDINIISRSSNNLLSFTYTITNKGTSEINLIDYWTRVKTKGGSKYTVKQITQDKEKKTVPAKSSETLTFYSEISNTITLKDLVFEFIVWDFNSSNFERIIGQFTVPSNYSMTVKPNFSYQIKSNGLLTSVQDVWINKGSEYTEVSMNYVMENLDNHSVTIPQYKFSLKTSEGILYPFESDLGTESVSILARDKKMARLTGKVPANLAIDNVSLILLQNEEAAKLDIPIISYQLPKLQTNSDTKLQNIEYNTSLGKYNITLERVQRLPWGNQDILVSTFNVKNETKTTLPLLTLAGEYKLDGVSIKDNEVTTINLDKILGIASNQQTKVIVYTKVPYTYSFTTIGLTLQSKVTGETSPRFIKEFKTDIRNLTTPTVRKNTTHVYDSVGKKTEVSVISTQTYSSDKTKLIYLEMELTNKEKRTNTLPKLEGLLKTQNDEFFPLTIKALESAIVSNGTVMISAWAEVPNKTNTSGSTVTIGEGVTKTTTNDENTASDAFINAVNFILPNEDNTVKSDLQGIEIYPYEITIRQPYATLNAMGNVGMKLDFEYDLKKTDTESDLAIEPHKLVIEFVDQGRLNTTYVRGLSLEGASEVENLIIGDKVQKTITFEDEDIFMKIQKFESYKINIYDEVKGHRKLIATYDGKWFEKIF